MPPTNRSSRYNQAQSLQLQTGVLYVNRTFLDAIAQVLQFFLPDRGVELSQRLESCQFCAQIIAHPILGFR